MKANGVAKFPLGRLAATPGSLEALAACGQSPAEFLARHQAGDYGTVNDEDWKLNDRAVEDGDRVFSAFLLNDGETTIWCVTEADRSSTTLLLPSDY